MSPRVVSPPPPALTPPPEPRIRSSRPSTWNNGVGDGIDTGDIDLENTAAMESPALVVALSKTPHLVAVTSAERCITGGAVSGEDGLVTAVDVDDTAVELGDSDVDAETKASNGHSITKIWNVFFVVEKKMS